MPDQKLLLILLTSLGLVACGTSSRYSLQHDSAPDHHFDAEQIPDAVPRPEPKSKYGNPASYVVHGKRYYVKDSSQGYVARGTASWYGKKFHGHRTSSGETYDMYAMTAAHKTLPLPTYVEVTHLQNGKRIIVKVNDRGPFHDNRIIDLSYAAAKKLGITGNGTAAVEVRAVDPRSPQTRPQVVASKSKYIAARQGLLPAQQHAGNTATPAAPLATDPQLYVQVGAFASLANAERLRDQISQQFAALNIDTGIHPDNQLYRVRIGPLSSPAEADQIAARIADSGLATPRVVSD